MINPEFWATALIVILIPGTGVIYTISTGLLRGPRASTAAAVGCTLGIIPHLLASTLGLSFILHMSALLFQGLKIAGVLYLFYLAWQMWRDRSEIRLDGDAAGNSSRQIAARAILINLLNPKLTLFFFAFLPQFITPDSGAPLEEMVGLSLAFMLLTLLIFALYGLLASSLRRRMLGSPHLIIWLRRSFAAAFVGLGVRLAFSE